MDVGLVGGERERWGKRGERDGKRGGSDILPEWSGGTNNMVIHGGMIASSEIQSIRKKPKGLPRRVKPPHRGERSGFPK